MNGLRLRSGHVQRKNYFYFAILENLRIFQNCLFTGGVVEENGICSAAFCESAALGESTPSVCSLRSQPAPPRGRLMALPETLPPPPKAVPLRADFPRPGEDVA